MMRRARARSIERLRDPAGADGMAGRVETPEELGGAGPSENEESALQHRLRVTVPKRGGGRPQGMLTMPDPSAPGEATNLTFKIVKYGMLLTPRLPRNGSLVNRPSW